MKRANSRYSKPSNIRTASFGSSRFAGAPVTKWMMIAIAVIFLVDISAADQVGRLKPYLEMSSERLVEVWRWLGYAFVDFNVMGWIFSLFVLYGFGRMIEQSIGSRRFTVFIGYCIIGAALVYALVSLGSKWSMPLTGASSLTLGLVVAAAMMYPELQVQLLIPPVPVKMKTLAMFLIGFIVIMSIMQRVDPAVSLAQLSGVAVAYFCMKKISLLDLGKGTTGAKFKKKTTKKKYKRPAPVTPAKPKKKQGMKARTVLNMSVSKREAEVNRILDKVSDEGIGNLTDEEKEILKFAAQDK